MTIRSQSSRTGLILSQQFTRHLLMTTPSLKIGSSRSTNYEMAVPYARQPLVKLVDDQSNGNASRQLVSFVDVQPSENTFSCMLGVLVHSVVELSIVVLGVVVL